MVETKILMDFLGGGGVENHFFCLFFSPKIWGLIDFFPLNEGIQSWGRGRGFAFVLCFFSFS